MGFLKRKNGGGTTPTTGIIMYNTKLMVEFNITTQFGPQDAVNMVDVLSRVPAIKSVKVVSLETDYKPASLKDANGILMRSIPHTIR